MIGIAGRNDVSVDATLTGQLGPLGFSISGGRSDEVTGFGDLAPLASLRWNHGVHNYMTYITGDIPVGAYDPTRLANLGIGHGAVDAGFGYTYFDPKTGNEFSAVLGFTYNLENQQTDYKNGVDMHLDWGASKFLTKQLQVGLVGYFYEQISPDSGSGRPGRQLRVACDRYRPAAWLHLPGRRHAGLPEPQGLQGICRRASPRRLEHVADVRTLAGSAESGRTVDEIARRSA